jgi:hypothetical protein
VDHVLTGFEGDEAFGLHVGRVSQDCGHARWDRVG